MAYIGKVPTAVPLTSSDLADSIVTSAKITDGTITLADLSATGTKDATTFLRGDNTFAEAGGGGITEADQWRLTADSSGNGIISSNLERVDNTGFDKIGTGMSVSSGVWTFPSTGIYLVRLIGSIFTDGSGANDNDITGEIYITTDNGSNWTNYASSAERADNNYATMVIEAFFDVTNTSNVKAKFEKANFNTGCIFRGNTNVTHTSFVFIRLGDT